MSTDYFSKALSDFTNNIASGDAIRHLADLGYTVNEIHDRLDFPTPHSRISDTVWRHYIETGVIHLEEPDGRPMEKVSYVREYDNFGRAYFKQVREVVLPETAQYIPVDFGIKIYQNRAAFEESLSDLEPRDRDYILSLPWPLKMVWHIADERMSRISRAVRHE